MALKKLFICYLMLFFSATLTADAEANDADTIDLDDDNEQESIKEDTVKIAIFFHGKTNLPQNIRDFISGDMKYYPHVMFRDIGEDPAKLRIFKNEQMAAMYLLNYATKHSPDNEAIRNLKGFGIGANVEDLATLQLASYNLEGLSVGEVERRLAENGFEKANTIEEKLAIEKEVSDEKEAERAKAKRRIEEKEKLTKTQRKKEMDQKEKMRQIRNKERRRKRLERRNRKNEGKRAEEIKRQKEEEKFEEEKKKFKPRFRLGENVGMNLPIPVFIAISALMAGAVLFVFKSLCGLKNKRLEEERAKSKKNAIKEKRRMEKDSKRLSNK
ncbi:hypothetical protein MHBO_001255 [Bonamia ostreae]|uniref:Uncharacterized protein n=1 Tax=Bonamia ostreae TaxID=126728 RepID=A0ABV2AJJ9_9EUKA